MPIPKIIHQTFDVYQRLPDALKDNCKAIAAMNSDCEYRFYEKKEISKLIRDNFGERNARALQPHQSILRGSQI